MFCGNCGKEIPDGALFCEECGAKTAEEAAEEVKEETAPEFCGECGAMLPEGSEVCPACGKNCAAEAVAEETSGKIAKFIEPVKKKLLALKDKLLKKSIVVPAVIAAVVIVAAAASYPYIKNAAAKLFMNDEKYFAHVLTDNADDMADTVADRVAAMKKSYTKGTGGKAAMDIEVGKGMSSLLKDLDVDEVEEYITWFKKASLACEVNYKGSKMSAMYDVKVNGKDLGKFDMIFDMSNMSYYFGIPDYNPEYLNFEADGGMMYYGDMGEFYESLEKVAKALPNEAKTKKIIKRYVKTLASGVKNVEESKEVIEAEGVSQKVTVLSFDIDGEFVEGVAMNVLTELQGDKEVKKIVGDVLTAADADVDVDEVWEVIDEAVQEIEEEDFDFEKVATFELYVDSKGEIVGFKVKGEEFTVASYSTVKGGKYGSETEIRADGTTVKLVGKGRVSGNKRTGDYKVKASGITVLEFSVKKLDTKLLEKGILNGSITIKAPESVVSMLNMGDMGDVISDLSITLKSNSKKLDVGDFEIAVKYGKEDCVKLSARASETSVKKIKEPKKYIDATDYDELEEWATKFKFDELKKRLKAAKFPDEVIDAVEEAEDSL